MTLPPLYDRAATTCVLADDHPPILDSLTRYLDAAGFVVVATALDGAKALAAVIEHRPAVCIADVAMPQLNGLALTREVRKAVPETGILLYSGTSDTGLVSEALDAGVLGFALKDAPLEDLSHAIDVVAGGGLYVDPVLAAAFVAAGRGDMARPLSPRERQVLRLLADGSSYAEMGAVLFLSPDTVRTHTQRAMAKISARTRTHAVAIAMRDGLIA